MRLISALLALSLSIAYAQRPPNEVPRKDAESVTVPFFVIETHGSPTNAQADISVVDNKTPVQTGVAIHPARELPLRLGILMTRAIRRSAAACISQQYRRRQIF
jgi:hypothetical protein